MPGTRSDAYDLIGLAVPYETPSIRVEPARTEWFARGAFHDVFTSGDVALLINHDTERVLGRQSDGGVRLVEHEAGVYAFVRYRQLRDRAAGARLNELAAAGKIWGWSVSFGVASCDGDYSSDSGSFRCTHVGKLFSVSLMCEQDPAYGSTWASPDTPDARERLIREQVEAVERRYNHRYLPGLSDQVDSRTPYLGAVSGRVVRLEREFPSAPGCLLKRLVFQTPTGTEHYG